MMLKDQSSQERLYVRALHLFGRNAEKADTHLANQDASHIHATIRWSGDRWELSDHSRNGTFIDGKRLPANTHTVLMPGQMIRFGPGSDRTWRVEELTPPAPMLIPIPGRDGDDVHPATAIALQELHFLPDDIEPQACVHRTRYGNWIWQNGFDSVELKDRDTIHLGSNSWRFFDAKDHELTQDVGGAQRAADVQPSFSFTVSLNEEHVNLSVAIAERHVDLGERAHHYCLLTLARQRISDVWRGLDGSTQGWVGVDQLARMLGLEPGHLNMQLFRARAQLAKLFPHQRDLLDIVERRRGEVRLTAYPFEIIRGAQFEANFDPRATR